MIIDFSSDIFIPLYQPYLTDYSKDVEIYYGGRNSGKSWFVYDKHIILALQDPKSVTLVVRKFRNSIKESCWKTVLERLDHFHIPYDENISDFTIVLRNGARFVFVGADNPDKIKSLLRIERIIYEEADGISIDEYQVISGSIRGSSKYKFESFMFNPPKQEFWLFNYYMNNVDLEILYENKVVETDKARIFHSTWRDNNFADQVRLEEKYSYMKSIDYFRWLRDSEGRLGFSESEYCLVPYTFIDKALKSKLVGNPKVDEICMGVDCARFGADETVITYRIGNEVMQPIKLKGKRGHEIAEYCLNLALDIKAKNSYKGKVNISVDDTGLGASTSDSLYKFKKDNKTKYASIIINEINFANKAKNEDLYSNFISEIAFYIKDLLINEKIKLPDNKELIEEISLREYVLDNKNRQKLETKDEFKKKNNGRSPDTFDSLLMCFANKIKKNIVFF